MSDLIPYVIQGAITALFILLALAIYNKYIKKNSDK